MQEILSKKILGERIRSLRIEKAYSQSYVADFLNLSRSNYSQIELGHQYPNFHTLHALSAHYHKSYEWFLHGERTRNLMLPDAKTAGREKDTAPALTMIITNLEERLQQFSISLKLLENELGKIKKSITELP